ncbi:fumarylacetoacetate hydrolase family protein [Nocardia inohanensis]|uniref:fumarylacetoacetate hydrolase family protein n=1 Tax=Nocardia inohanensis TaxID=209246 RepID=UPI0008340358|nr:fumarylacetoacetate hydrolase family protein [Nocardia inohanensis]
MTRHALRFEGPGRPAASSPLLPAGVRLPGSLIGIGENYRPDATPRARPETRIPLIFGKFPGCVTGDGAPIVVDPRLSEQVVCEGELALVVGERARGLRTEQQALDALAGICLANDVSARDLQAADGQSTRGKSLDGFCPLGPELVTLDELPDLRALELTTRVNERVVQQASTAQLVFSIPELVLFCANFMTLYPGDVILTGTPVAADEALRLRPGDIVEICGTGLGVLRNPVVAR